MQDHYETLQVHPRADAEAVRAAYDRLRQRYDPERLEGAADELQSLARRRRDAIERAYAVLGDAERRRAYDLELAERGTPVARVAVAEPEEELNPDDLIDYAPLPPARGQERPEGFDAQPSLPPGRLRRVAGRDAGRPTAPIWVAPALIVAAATFGIVMVTLITTVLSTPTSVANPNAPQLLGSPVATVVPTASIAQVIDQFEGQVMAARQVAEQVPQNVNAWIELGNALYDSAVVVRERLASDPSLQGVYVERLPRWLEAAEAYRRATELEPNNALARADLAASLCYYGQDTNDQSFVAQGLAEAQRAVADNPAEGRALLSHGFCLVASDPPRTAEALEQWQRLVVLPGANEGLVFQARQLMQEYGQ
jgi:curved DNA-binding protein CbpA